MPYFAIDTPKLREARLRISGSVSAKAGGGIIRRVILRDHNRILIAEAISATDGRISFEINGTSNDVFVAQAVGIAGECDAISCPTKGVPV